MVIDLRKQNRIIKIELEQASGKMEIDDFVDNIVNDLKIILEQRGNPNKIKIEIILE